MHQANHFGGHSVIVWVGIYHGGKTAVTLTGIRYRDEILQHHVIPHMYDNGGSFQHDTVMPHYKDVKKRFIQIIFQLR